jgi:hypothetical protein
MRPWIRNSLLVALGLVVLFALFVWWLAQKPAPEHVTYGMSFNTLYARELGLDWRETYDALLDDLGVRHLRLAAHWPMVEPQQDRFNFTELDYQLNRADEVGADVVFAIGRRLPRWPECHIPSWARELSWEAQKRELREYITAVVHRYKDRESIVVWQVENEPYLEVFAFEHCGHLDEDFLKEEIELVRSLDPSRPVLVTDSGNLGLWKGAYKNGDMFGTSVYVHFWNPDLGQFRTILPPWVYRAKERFLAIFYGKKDTVLIELSAEPWLIEPITDVPVSTQLTRMNVDKFNDILVYARNTRYQKQYLWGAEWWYWLMKQGDASMWERGKEVINGG